MNIRQNKLLFICPVLLTFLCNGCCQDDGEGPPDDDRIEFARQLPSITEINQHPSDTFLGPLDQIGNLITGLVPMPGSDSGCYHGGAHLVYAITDTRDTVDIIAPLDGIISRVDACFPIEGDYEDPIYDQQYKINLAYAQADGELFELELGIEPMAGKLCQEDRDYFKPYINVEYGQKVHKGDKLGEMVLEPGAWPHIHFNSKHKLKFICPDIFTTEVLSHFTDYMWDNCNGVPFSTLLPGGICYLPAFGESNGDYPQ